MLPIAGLQRHARETLAGVLPPEAASLACYYPLSKDRTLQVGLGMQMMTESETPERCAVAANLMPGATAHEGQVCFWSPCAGVRMCHRAPSGNLKASDYTAAPEGLSRCRLRLQAERRLTAPKKAEYKWWPDGYEPLYYVVTPRVRCRLSC